MTVSTLVGHETGHWRIGHWLVIRVKLGEEYSSSYGRRGVRSEIARYYRFREHVLIVLR